MSHVGARVCRGCGKDFPITCVTGELEGYWHLDCLARARHKRTLPAEQCQQCNHHQEMYRRVFGRWGDFDAAVVKAQELMRACGSAEMLAAADEIDRVRMGIGGQP
jgi:hypothetical protein